MKWRDKIQLDNFEPDLGIFAALFLIYLPFGPGVQQYVWQGVIRTVIWLFFKTKQTVLFKEKFVREYLVLELELSSCSTSFV